MGSCGVQGCLRPQIRPHPPQTQNKTHSFVIAYRVDLGAKHDCGEREEQEALKAQEDQQDYSYGR